MNGKLITSVPNKIDFRKKSFLNEVSKKDVPIRQNKNIAKGNKINQF